MDIVKNGESSTSPPRHTVGLAANGDLGVALEQGDELRGKDNKAGLSNRLVLPQWDGMLPFVDH